MRDKKVRSKAGRYCRLQSALVAPLHSGSRPEKGRLVAKLRSGRQRKRLQTGKKVGGRKSHVEMWPTVVALAKRLRRANPKTGERRSFREISELLAKAGHRNERGQPFNPQSVRAMIEGPQARQQPGTRRLEPAT